MIKILNEKLFCEGGQAQPSPHMGVSIEFFWEVNRPFAIRFISISGVSILKLAIRLQSRAAVISEDRTGISRT